MIRYCILLLLFSSTLIAQDADTLLPRILQMENDTEKVNQLYSTGFSLRNKDPQLAYIFAKHCETAALHCSSKKHLAKSYNLLGVLYYKKGNFKTALNYHQNALQLRLKCNDVLGIANSETNLGNIYSDIKLYPQAEAAYLKALEAYNQLNDKVRGANCLINLGILKQNLNQLDAAFENYSMALKIAESIHDYDIKILCLNNLAVIYGLKGDYDKAISYNEDALKLKELTDNTIEKADSYLNLAMIYVAKKEFDKAKFYIDTAYAIGNAYDYFGVKHQACKTYSHYYSLSGNYELAYQWLYKFDKINDSIQVFQSAAQKDHDFTELEQDVFRSPSQNHINNLWVIISVLALLIIIPFFILRNKR